VAFKKATKHQQKLRLAISGPAGSGKTYTALAIAKHLGARVALIDTEHGSASLYAGDVADFDTNELEHFSVQNYLRAMREAAQAGYDVLVIDSMTHAWAGKGGILEEADKRGGKFQAWAELTPLQQSLIEAVLSYPGHVIATMRSKMEYKATVTKNRNGDDSIKVEKLGLAPVQREGVEYEFTLMLDMNERHVGTITKSRCSALEGAVLTKPGKELAEQLLAWLNSGAPQESPAPGTSPSAARDASSRAAPRTDEYGLTVPSHPCPMFTREGPNKGKRWDEVPGPLIEKMLEDFGPSLSNRQIEWGTYLGARRSARKAREASEAAHANEAPSPDGSSTANGQPTSESAA
jgi:DNA polymerase III delta prime subunit